MSEKVTNLIGIRTTSNNTDEDTWSAFRQVERITVELTQSYQYSLGKYSRFFIELENQTFLATQCGSCGKVYAPPRPLCPNCLQVTGWIELAGEGTVKTYSVLHFSPGTNADVNALETPYVLAYVHLDGADTLFPHLVRGQIDDIHIGLRVKVAYPIAPVSHPIHLMYFVPLEDQ